MGVITTLHHGVDIKWALIPTPILNVNKPFFKHVSFICFCVHCHCHLGVSYAGWSVPTPLVCLKVQGSISCVATFFVLASAHPYHNGDISGAFLPCMRLWGFVADHTIGFNSMLYISFNKNPPPTIFFDLFNKYHLLGTMVLLHTLPSYICQNINGHLLCKPYIFFPKLYYVLFVCSKSAPTNFDGRMVYNTGCFQWPTLILHIHTFPL